MPLQSQKSRIFERLSGRLIAPIESGMTRRNDAISTNSPETFFARQALLLLGLGVIFAAGFGVRTMMKSVHDAEVLAQSEKVVEGLSGALQQFQFGLQGIVGASQVVSYHLSTAEFRSYALALNKFNDFRGALGFGFIRRVRKADRQAYLNRQKKENPLFVAHTLTDPVAQELGTSFFIELIEPYEPNRQALGLDIASEHLRQAAAIQAMKSGRPTLTRKIQLIQSEKIEPGFLYLVPIYRGGSIPAQEEDRIRSLEGWAYTPILATSLVQNALAPFTQPHLLRIFQDSPDGEDHLLFETGSKAKASSFRVDWSKKILMGDQVWIIQQQFLSNELFASYNLGGLLASLVLLLFVGAIVIYLRNLESEALSETKTQLLEQNLLFSTLIENIPVAVFLKDPQDEFRIKLWNKAAEEIFRISSQEAVGRRVQELWPEQVEENPNFEDPKVMAAGVRVDYETSALTQSRGKISVWSTQVPFRL